MKYKRAIMAAITLWVLSFAAYMMLFLIPGVSGNENRQYIAFYVLTVPLVLLTAKWYFKMDPPSVKKGFLLGLVMLAIGFVLDMGTFAISAFGTSQDFLAMVSELYADWKFYVAIAEVLLIATYAGWEFDRTFTRSGQS